MSDIVFIINNIDWAAYKYMQHMDRAIEAGKKQDVFTYRVNKKMAESWLAKAIALTVNPDLQ